MDEFTWIRDDERHRHGERLLPAAEPTEILWLRVGFCTAFDAAGFELWRQQLHAFLTGCDLAHAIALERIAIFPGRRAITSFDRGRVIGWLTAQPLVEFVRIDRGAAIDRSMLGHSGARRR